MAEIRYDIGVEGAEEGAQKIDDLNKSVKDLGSTSADAKNKSSALGDSFEILGGMAGAATAAFTAATAGIAAAGAAFVTFSAEVERRAGIMRAFNGSVAETLARTNGMVSSLEAMTTANRLARAGIQATGHDLANIMVAAVTSAQERGEDLNQTIDQLAEALGGASADELRKFGIEVTTGASRTATLNQALDQLGERYGAASVAANSFGGALTAIENTLSDFATVFQEVVDQTGVLADEWNQLMEDFGLSELTIGNLRQTIETAAIALGATFVESIRTARGEITDFLQTLGRVMQMVREGDFADAVTAFREFGERSANRRSDLGARIGERAAEIGSALAMRRDERERGSRTRRIRRDGGSASEQPTLDELMGGAAASGTWEEAVDTITNDALEGLTAIDDARKASDQLAHDLAEREKERIAELTERRKDAAAAELEVAREAMQKVHDDAMGVLAPAVAGLTDALSNVLAGTQSADEAFQGLLTSFLEMLSQKAALEAAGQFAAAIASFASQDYGGGALHVAAGVAWTAVAVAAGAASVAVAPPAASAQPAATPQNANPGPRGGDVVLNINGAIAFGGTRAELGREFGSAIQMADRRFGAAA